MRVRYQAFPWLLTQDTHAAETFQHRTDPAVTPGKVDVDILYVIGIQPEVTA